MKRSPQWGSLAVSHTASQRPGCRARAAVLLVGAVQARDGDSAAPLPKPWNYNHLQAYERAIFPTYFSDRAPYNISQGALHVALVLLASGGAAAARRFCGRPHMSGSSCVHRSETTPHQHCSVILATAQSLFCALLCAWGWRLTSTHAVSWPLRCSSERQDPPGAAQHQNDRLVRQGAGGAQVGHAAV